jgi:hypothetical protein
VGVILLMVMMAVMVSVMVMYTQNEAKWSVKQTENMAAFQLAEGGIDRGYRKVSESTKTWANGQLGIFPAGYKLDQAYTDMTGGCYTIALSSGPDKDQVRVISISRQSKGKETRAIQATYSSSPLGDTAIYGKSGVTMDGSQTDVNWGAVISPNSLTVNSRTYPQFWSSGSIDLDTNGNSQPNCDTDCVGWHSYEQDIPSDPGIDLDGFYQDALSSGTYFGSSQCWGKNSGTACGVACNTTCSDATSCKTDKTYYILGDLCIEGKIFVQGRLIVTGSMTLPNGNAGYGEERAPLPPKAWKQYGRNWAQYRDMDMDCGGSFGGSNSDPVDPTAPASFPGLSSSYKAVSGGVDAASSGQKCLGNVVAKGFTYVGGNLNQIGGAGGADWIGAVYVAGSVNITPNTLHVWYWDDAGDYMKTTSVILTRESWIDLPERQWPSNLTCTY